MSTKAILKVLETELFYATETAKMEIDRGQQMIGLSAMLHRLALLDFLIKLEPNRFKKIDVYL